MELAAVVVLDVLVLVLVLVVVEELVVEAGAGCASSQNQRGNNSNAIFLLLYRYCAGMCVKHSSCTGFHLRANNNCQASTTQRTLPFMSPKLGGKFIFACLRAPGMGCTVYGK